MQKHRDGFAYVLRNKPPPPSMEVSKGTHHQPKLLKETGKNKVAVPGKTGSKGRPVLRLKRINLEKETMTCPANVIEAFRRAEQEMQDEWEARQAAVAKCPVSLRPQALAAHWLIMFAPDRVTVVQAGVPIGNVLDSLKQQGRELPPAVQSVWQEWHEKIEAAGIECQRERMWWLSFRAPKRKRKESANQVGCP